MYVCMYVLYIHTYNNIIYIICMYICMMYVLFIYFLVATVRSSATLHQCTGGKLKVVIILITVLLNIIYQLENFARSNL